MKAGYRFIAAGFGLVMLFSFNVACKSFKFNPFSKKPKMDTLTTASGLHVQFIDRKKDAPKPKAGDKVAVHYTGLLQDGTKFDSSMDRGEPISFVLGQGQVIKGWDEGIAMLGEGDSAVFTIPPALGYGNQNVGPIPANSTLIFQVKLVSFKEMPQAKPYNVEGKDTLSTASGLKYIVVEEGKGPKAAAGRNTIVHYTGYLLNGTKFDSSVDRDEPFTFPLGGGRVIRGWDEGLQLMTIGSKYRLILPPDLAYGSRGAGHVIPPNSTLIFDVELLGQE